ncbi:Glycosyl transferase family 2 [Rubripirellula tenax]|uniref:Glycosyl transferase family 2 n=2 Tax=Rubripirellula tenax TaxID=2528015 RepID=A0A5C6EEU5_9BACT|nr:Glycosyl transferase family 2 [Rubripirellula tenax]
MATAAGATKIVRSLPGRGTQQNSGAFMAKGDWLLFLHADNRLDADCIAEMTVHAGRQGSRFLWGAFKQRIESPRPIYRWIEQGNAARVRWRSMAYGDQAIFVRRDIFKQVGGFPDIPLMEDVELSKALRKRGKPFLLSGPVTISSRRWESHGVVKQTLKNWRLRIAHATGTHPAELSVMYDRGGRG